jgi:hypothetical protein
MRWLRFWLLLELTMPLFAGCGLFVDSGNPRALTDPVLQNAFVTVRLFNCLGASRDGNGIPYPREDSMVRVAAEGQVYGRRVSIPLRVVKLSKPGMSAVYWELPAEGVWLLNVQIANAGPYYIGTFQPVVAVLVPVSPAGIDRRPQLVRAPPTIQEITEALCAVPKKVPD